MTDLTVMTPYGMGVFQLGRFMDRDGYRYLVRLPVTDETRPHLNDRHCLTPKAKLTCLFSFTAEELGLKEE
jgi:hypothetical protein